ncbi:MAG: hypothetical protein QM817_08905 [Archangium sp.]
MFTRLCALVLALGALVASASVVVYESIDDMARRVPLIVRARVARSIAGWDAEHKRIWTWTEVVVSDQVKGKASGLILVKQPGGEVDGIGQSVAGVAQFREGEDCVLFLEPAPDEKNVWRPSGLSAGKVNLVVDRGQPTALRVTEGLSFVAQGSRKVEPVLPRELLGSPEDFLKRIRAAVGGAR